MICGQRQDCGKLMKKSNDSNKNDQVQRLDNKYGNRNNQDKNRQ